MQAKRVLFSLGLGGLVILLLTYPLLHKEEVLAVCAGYLLFSINYVLLASLMHRLVMSPASSSRGVLFFISALKFFGLIGILYVLLVPYRLSGLHLAAGALASLLILSVVLYLRYMRTPSLSQPP